MKIIKPSIAILTEINTEDIYKKIELIGRTCYKSENLITEDSAKIFIRNIVKSGHESVIEHINISIKIICDRGVTHEIVRHRIASYSQESTRYCNYSKDKFGNELSFIKPCFWHENSEEYLIWSSAMEYAERTYLKLIESGVKPEEARSVLPNSLKTEIVMTANLREWRHFLKLRTSEKAHPQMREIANLIKEEFTKTIPLIFENE